MKFRCECGRLPLALPMTGRFRSRSARARKPYGIKHHELCFRCWRRMMDSFLGKGNHEYAFTK